MFKLFKKELGKSIALCSLGHGNCPYYTQLEDTYLDVILYKSYDAVIVKDLPSSKGHHTNNERVLLCWDRHVKDYMNVEV
eukprot:4460815-Ditylum_brightwellii.AAC.1